MNPADKPPRPTTPLPRPREAIEYERRQRIVRIILAATFGIGMMIVLLLLMLGTNPKP